MRRAHKAPVNHRWSSTASAPLREVKRVVSRCMVLKMCNRPRSFKRSAGPCFSIQRRVLSQSCWGGNEILRPLGSIPMPARTGRPSGVCTTAQAAGHMPVPIDRCSELETESYAARPHLRGDWCRYRDGTNLGPARLWMAEWL